MARTISVVKWETEEEVDNAVHEIKAEIDRGGGLTSETERAMQHSFLVADPDLTNYFLRTIREQVPEALRYFEERGGGA